MLMPQTFSSNYHITSSTLKIKRGAIMGRKERICMRDNYQKIGNLTDQQFLAVKSLNHKLFYASHLDVNNIIKIDKYGHEEQITRDQIQDAIGETLKFRATIRPMNGNREASGSLTMENITDATYDPKTGFLMVDCDKFCMTNTDCGIEMQDLGLLLAAPNVWVTKEALSIIIPESATLSDFAEVREEFAHTREQDKEIESHSQNTQTIDIDGWSQDFQK